MRLRTTVLLLLTLVGPSAVLAKDANEQVWVDTPEASFWVYSVTWQPTFCLMRPDTPGCDSAPQRLLTHGIWPYNQSTDESSNRHPQFCTTSESCKNDACSMSDDQMNRVLANEPLRALVTTEPKGMFAHEWKKHGTCSGLSMEGYFQAFVDLREKVVVQKDPEAFARMIGRATEFSRIREVFPANTAFRCYRDKDGRQYLHEVFYLIDRQGEPYLKEKNLQIGVQCQPEETWIL
ncbi:ribonuclease T2 family protein [Pseudomonas putida]